MNKYRNSGVSEVVVYLFRSFGRSRTTPTINFEQLTPFIRNLLQSVRTYVRARALA